MKTGGCSEDLKHGAVMSSRFEAAATVTPEGRSRAKMTAQNTS